ncbi:MAG: putR 1, partial [Frankiales bacterium]|nr:putR 1 [Frankiales bacterium]
MVPADDERGPWLRQTAGVPTLRSVLEALGPALTSYGDLEVEVNEVVLVGPGDPVPSAPGALLVVQDSSALGPVDAAAVVVRGAPPELGVPVVCAPDDLPWNHLLHLLISAVSASDGGDLFALANSVAAAVGGAVAIEDPSRRVLAYSSLPEQAIDEARQQGILGRQVPDLSRNDDLYRALQRAPGVLRVPADGDVLPRLAVAVRAGAELLGSIWVV